MLASIASIRRIEKNYIHRNNEERWKEIDGET